MKRLLAVASLVFALATLLTTHSVAQNYFVFTTAFAPVASPTDIIVITAGSKGVLINKVWIQCTQTTAGIIDVLLVKRTSANSGGTSASLTVNKNDSNNTAATATAVSYSVNATGLGTAAGTRPFKLACLAPATAAPTDMLFYNGITSNQPWQINNTEFFAINMNGVTLTGGSMDIWIEWTERQ